MWILCEIGFFSVDQKPGQDDLTVRGRVAADLDRLRAAYMPELSPTLETPHSDYPFRATINRAALGRGLAKIGQSVHYESLREEVGRLQGYEREGIYAQVANTLRKLQKMP